MGKVNNALRMLAILRSRNKVTRKELAEELEVNVREITRYKEHLESCGVWIKEERGRYGGYRLEHKDYLMNLELSKSEEKALNSVESFVRNKNLPYYIEFKQAVEKINAINPRFLEKESDDVIFVKQTKSKISYAHESNIWLVVNDGIINSRKLSIDYMNANGKYKKRIVRPYGIYTYNNSNYLVGFCEYRQEIRQFKFARVKDIVLLEERFPKTDFSLKDYLGNSIGVFKDEKINIKLKVLYPYAQNFHEIQWVPDENIEDHREEGFLIYNATMEGKKQIVNWIMGMGECCEVLEPEGFKNEIIDIYRSILKKYIE